MSKKEIKAGSEYYVRVRILEIVDEGDVYASIVNEDGEEVMEMSTFFSNTEAETFIPVGEPAAVGRFKDRKEQV